jgi:hypothetical protein
MDNRNATRVKPASRAGRRNAQPYCWARKNKLVGSNHEKQHAHRTHQHCLVAGGADHGEHRHKDAFDELLRVLACHRQRAHAWRMERAWGQRWQPHEA